MVPSQMTCGPSKESVLVGVLQRKRNNRTYIPIEVYTHTQTHTTHTHICGERERHTHRHTHTQTHTHMGRERERFIMRNWGLRNPTVCPLQAGDPGKLVI